VYSRRTILEHFLKLKEAFKEIKPLICYSVKANSNLSLLALLTAKGAGLDIVSGGELYRAKKVKCPAKKIVYASVGKLEPEIIEAINYGILMFNVESEVELRRIDEIAGKLNKKVDIALRFNPDVECGTHKYITTGKKETKFGMDRDTVKNIFLNRRIYRNLNIIGLHVHIGSQLTQSRPFVKAIRKAKSLIGDIKKKGIQLKYFNIGGGLGIVYDREKPQTAFEFANKILPLLRGIGLQVVLEPGRFIMGNAGVLVAKVAYIKDTSQKRFIIVDAAMNDLARPSLYNAYHKIIPLTENRKINSVCLREGQPKAKDQKLADVVGPICEGGDFLGKDRDLDVGEDGYVAVLGAGAYGFSMSSNYNSRPRAAEVLVKDNQSFLIRKREDYKDLVDKEILFNKT